MYNIMPIMLYRRYSLMGKERDCGKPKTGKRRKRQETTALDRKWYIVLGIASLLLILLLVIVQTFECIQVFLMILFEKLIEIMAAGMLPAVVLAYLTDKANTKRQRYDYDKRIETQKETLKSICLDASSEILVCLNTSDYSEKNEKKTFKDWCIQFSNGEETFSKEIAYFAQSIHDIEKEASSFLKYLNTYGECIFDEMRLPEKSKATNLIKASKKLYGELRRKNKKDFLDNRQVLIKQF